MKSVILLLSVMLMSSAHAESIKEIEKEECVNRQLQRCISNFCALESDISEDVNCQEICKKRAKKLCQQQGAETQNSNVIDVN